MIFLRSFVCYFGIALFLSSISIQAQEFFKAKKQYHWLSTDLHIHTVFSDGDVWPSIRVEEARREGLDLIAITEHLEYQPHSEDIPHPDRNRSFIIANDMVQPNERLQVINGSEITRKMPPGHINAVFIKDGNALLYSDSLSGIEAANKQGGFVFWNHPNYDKHRPDGIARLEPFHKYLIKNKLLHGIEVVNGLTYSEEALKIALDNNLTILGTSDIHSLTDWKHSVSSGGHRPMTFVLTDDKTPVALKKALFEGKTVVWFDNLLIGKKDNIEDLVRNNLSFDIPIYPKGKTILNVELTNHSASPFHLEYTGEYTFHQRSSIFIVPAKSSMVLMIKTEKIRNKLSLPFKVLNTVIAPKKHLNLIFILKQQI